MKYVLWIILFFPMLGYAEQPITAVTVRVLDSQSEPVPSCLVQIGMAPQTPFPGNFSVTNSEGLTEFQVDPIQSQPITLVCPNRATVTYLQQSGTTFKLSVDDLLESQITEVAGKFSGWSEVGQKGNVDFSLMIPSVSLSKIFSLQWPDLVSQRMDSINVWGKTLKVPSNINIPKQKVKYGLLSATLEKTNTAFTLEGSKTKSFMSLTGKFQSQQLIQSYLGGETDYLKFIDMMDFYALGISKQVPSSSSIDLSVNQFKLKECLSMKSIVSIPGLNTIGVAVSNNNSDAGSDLQITDLKLLKSTPQVLKCPEKSTRLPLVTALATDKTAKATSQVVVRSPSSNAVIFNSFMAIPMIKSNNNGKSIEFTRAENTTLGFKASGFKATLFDLYSTNLLDKAVPQWIIFSPGQQTDVEKIDLPKLPDFFSSYSVNAAPMKHRWEVMWMGLDPAIEVAGTSQNIDFNFFGVATHASKNSIDY